MYLIRSFLPVFLLFFAFALWFEQGFSNQEKKSDVIFDNILESSYMLFPAEQKKGNWRSHLIGKMGEDIYLFANLKNDEESNASQSILILRKEQRDSFDFNFSDADKSNFITYSQEECVRKIGEIPLDDNWKGFIKLQGNRLNVENKGFLDFPTTPSPSIKTFKVESLPLPFSFSTSPFIDPELIGHLCPAHYYYKRERVVLYPDKFAKWCLKPDFVEETTVYYPEGQPDGDCWKSDYSGIYFSYDFKGQTTSGVYVLEFASQENHVSTPRHDDLCQYTHYPPHEGVLFLVVEQDFNLSADWDKQALFWNQPRTYMRYIGHGSTIYSAVQSVVVKDNQVIITYHRPEDGPFLRSVEIKTLNHFKIDLKSAEL